MVALFICFCVTFLFSFLGGALIVKVLNEWSEKYGN